MFHNDIAPADCARNRRIERGPVDRILAVLELGSDNFVFETRFTLIYINKKENIRIGSKNHRLTFDGAAVDGEIPKIRQKFLGTVLTEY